MSERTLKVSVEIAQMQTAIKDLVSSVDRLNKSIDQMGQRTTQNMTKAATSTRKVNKALNQQEQELKETLQQIKRLQRERATYDAKREKKISDLIQKERRLRAEIAKTAKVAKDGANSAAAAQGKLNKQVSLGRQLFLRLKSVMLTVFGAYAIIQGVRNTINVIKDFELGVKKVQAITGATAKEIDKLAGSAKYLAGQGIFNPTEITELQVILAKLGFTIDEIANSTEGIIDLATATGEELAPAAQLVSSIIRGLGLAASETARIVDVLGKSFTSSALDLNKFRESAKYIVPLARDMGWSIEQVSAVLGKLADSIISGSLAGTGMRTLFIELAKDSSDLSAIMGQGINTFDEFVDALIELEEKGVKMSEMMEIVPKRAVTLFSVLMREGEALRDFAKEMDNATGAIKEMADIQLNTLAYQMEQFNNSWQRFVVSVQENGGNITYLFKGLSMILNDISNNLHPIAMEIAAATKRATDSISGGMDEVKDRIVDINDELEIANKELEKWEGRDQNFHLVALEVKKLKAEIAGLTEESRLLNNALFDDKVFRRHQINLSLFTKEYESLLKIGKTEAIALDEAYAKVWLSLNDALDYAIENHLTGIPLMKAEIAAFGDFYEEHVAKMIQATKDLLTEDSEEFDNYIKMRRKFLASSKALELERNENRIQTELERELEVLRINTKYKKLNLTLDIASGKLTLEQIEIKNAQIIEAEKTLQRKVLELKKKYEDEAFEERRKIIEESMASRKKENEEDIKEAQKAFEDGIKLQRTYHKTYIQEMKNAGVAVEDIKRAEIEFEIKLLKLRLANAKLLELGADDIKQIAADIELYGAKLGGLFDDKTTDDVEKNVDTQINAYKRLATEIIRSLETIVDAQVDTTERTLDDLNTRIAEVQRDLERENDLYMEGYANNVTLKKKEYDELRVMREQALKDRDAAVRKQQRLEAISQAINLASAVSNVIKTYSNIPWVGLVIAGAMVAGFLALFSSAKKESKDLSSYGVGGEVDGRSHSQGGTVIEAERGEYVIKKSMYSKHPELVRAINEDNLPSLNQSVLNATTFNKDGETVIDTEIWNRIYDLLEADSNKRSVSMHGNKRIVIMGIKTRITNNV